MNLPTSQFLPSDDDNLSPARRRQRRRSLVPSTSDARAEFLKELSHRLTPSLDFYTITLLTAIILAAAILLDQPALYILAALIAPFLAPAIGLSLAAAVGSVRFFLRSLAAFTIGSLVVFAFGCAAGWVSTRLSPATYSYAFAHARFIWGDFLLLSAGIILTAYMLIRSRTSKPLVTSVALVYELYLPIGVAGFGLTGSVPGLWPDALLVFVIHLAWCALLGTLTMAVMGLRPSNVFGYTLGTTVTIVIIVAAVFISGLGTALTRETAMPSLEAFTEVIPSAAALVKQSPAPSLAPEIQPAASLPAGSGTSTATPTNTLVPTKTPTITLTPMATPVYAKIKPNEFGGAYIRKEPSFDSQAITSLSTDVMVIVVDEYTQADNVIWVKIRTISDDPVEGWIVRSLLITATPKAGW
jgi:uncharacterized membrane protein